MNSILRKRKPDFTNLQKVLECKKPDRPTLFELFMNDSLYEILTGRKRPNREDELEHLKFVVDAFKLLNMIMPLLMNQSLCS